VGYILAVAMPPLGVGVGLVLILSARLRSKHGAWIVLISIVAAAIWALMISSGALKDTNQGY
jgi:formate hydrogenlyase subunit 3/multisubunit Na+/H+ antiporter MnhD subunit